MNRCIRWLILGASVALDGPASFRTAAQPAPQEAFPANYQVEIELAPNEGPARLFRVVTAGEWVRAGFVVPPEAADEAEPTVLRFEAELQVMSPQKVWVRNLTLAHQLPPARRMGRAVPARPAAEPRREPRGPGGGPVERPQLLERRRPGEGAEGVEAPLAEPEVARRNLVAPREAPGFVVREMPPLESVINTSVLLTVGQPLVLREDPTGRVSLTLRRLDK